MWYKNIAGRFFELVTQQECDRRTEGQTDRRTDRQNYDSQDRASIASRGKNATRRAYIFYERQIGSRMRSIGWSHFL